MFIEVRLHHSRLELNTDKALSIIKAWVKNQKFTTLRWLYGVENKNKFGEETDEHIHYKFETDEDDLKKNSLQTSFRRYMSNYTSKMKGVKHYAIMMQTQPDDEDRWWRYCLKEKGAKRRGSPDMKDFIIEQQPQAENERELQVKRNLEARDKYIDKDSFKNKMFAEFQEERVGFYGSPEQKELEFCISLTMYYQKKKKVPPFSKIEDYWGDYRIMTAQIHPIDYFREKYARFRGVQLAERPEPNAGAGQAPDEENEWNSFDGAFDDE